MKLTNVHGKPIVNNRHAVAEQIHDEGLDEIDLEELALLQDACGDWDDDYEFNEDWIDEYPLFMGEEHEDTPCPLPPGQCTICGDKLDWDRYGDDY